MTSPLMGHEAVPIVPSVPRAAPDIPTGVSKDSRWDSLPMQPVPSAVPDSASESAQAGHGTAGTVGTARQIRETGSFPLDTATASCENSHTMAKAQSSAPISDLLRRTIVESGVPYLTLEQQTGVKRASIMRFVRCEQQLRIDNADKLAAYYGLKLTKRKEG